MSISINSLCVECLLKKHLSNARELGDSETAYAFAKDIMRIFLEAAPEDNSSVIGQRINQLYGLYYHLPQDRFAEEKKISNRFVKERLERIRRHTEQSPDPILTGLQYAIMGNYIDFSALGKNVSFETLENMLEHPEQFYVEETAYRSFRQELATAKQLLYLTDNAGEIGFDWVLAEQLQKQYPQLEITFCVRGMPAHNDATREDYAHMGIPFPVMDNGSDIGGTDLNSVNAQTLTALKNSDIVIAKGMGNTETLFGSGYNIYYAFLVKCPRFQEIFQKPMMEAMFLKERKKA